MNQIYFPWCHKIIPLSYDNSLSYYEQLCVVERGLNDIIGEYNKFVAELPAEINNIVKNSVDSISTEIKELGNSFDEFKEEYQTDFNTLIEDVEKVKLKIQKENKEFQKILNSEFDKFKDEQQNEMNNLVRFMNQYKRQIDIKFTQIADDLRTIELSIEKLDIKYMNRMDAEIKQLYEYIDEHISRRNSNNLLVTNPMTGKSDTLKNVLDMIYHEKLQIGCLSALEYDKMLLNAKEYDNWIVQSSGKKLSAFIFDFRSRLVFFDKIYLKNTYKHIADEFKAQNEKIEDFIQSLTMTNPFTGLKSGVIDVIKRLVRLHQNVLSAKEYDNLLLSATDYDVKNISAYNFDFNNKELLQP